MNLIDRYLTECVHNRNYNWMINNLYIEEDQLFNPTSGQQEILLTRDSMKAFILPRTAGATTLICMDALTEAVLAIDKEIFIFCPAQNACRNTSRLLSTIAARSAILIEKATQNEIRFNNGSRIFIVTPQLANYRGYRPNAVYIDNFDMINSEDLSNIFSRLVPHYAEKVLMLGNNDNGYESTQRMVNINPTSNRRRN